MKVSFHATYDFKKAKKKLTSKILPNIYETAAKDTARRYKKNLREKQFTPLEESTLNIRKHFKISGKKPLNATGKLYKSIKAQKRSVSFLKYGEYQNEGFKTTGAMLIPNKTVPPRRWRDKRYALLTKKSRKRIFKEIFKGVRASGRGIIIK